MKRGVIQRIVVFLLLGAIANVAVAWGCAVFLNPNDVPMIGKFDVFFDERPPSLIGVQRRFGHTRINRLIGDNHRMVPYVSDEVPGQRSEDHAGWPMHSLVSYNYGDLRFDAPNHARFRYCDPHKDDAVGGIDLPKWKASSLWRKTLPAEHYYVWRAIPCRPLWPGFAINTIFYAAILWMMFFVPAKVKRTLRRRRGLCPACAYPIGTSSVCTECGRLIKEGEKNLHETSDAIPKH